MIRIERPVTKRCPYKDEIDHGTLVMTFPGIAPELHELAKQIEVLSSLANTHEDYTRYVAEAFPKADVQTYWDTAGWECCVTETRITVNNVVTPGINVT